MKTMKKLFALLMAVAMVLSMVVVANADETDPYAVSPTAMTDAGVLTIKNATAGYEYFFYRILDLASISSDGKPVYIMRADGMWDDFFDDADYGKSYFTITDEGYVKQTTLTTGDGQMLAALVADYASKHKDTIKHDIYTKMTTSGDYHSGTPRQFGYYVMTTSRTGTFKHTAFTLKDTTLDIEEKNQLKPTIDKYVQEDSEAGTGDSGWKHFDAAEESERYNVAEIEQPVKFKVVVHLKSGHDKYVITDTLDNHFEGLSNLTLEYSGGGTMDASRATVTSNDKSFTVTLTDLFRANLEDGTTLTITYTAKLKPDAVIGGSPDPDDPNSGNMNTVTMEFGPEGKRETISDVTYTKTYRLHVMKVDESGDALSGAEFNLYHEGATDPLKFVENADGSYTVTNASTGSSTLKADGTECAFTINGLDTVDRYVLKETKVPEGYVKMDDKTIVINPSDSDNFNAQTSTYVVTVENLPGVNMPTTGGMGTTIFYVVGGIMVLAAVVLLVTKKRVQA